MFKKLRLWWNNPDNWKYKPMNWSDDQFKQLVIIYLFIIIMLQLR